MTGREHPTWDGRHRQMFCAPYWIGNGRQGRDRRPARTSAGAPLERPGRRGGNRASLSARWFEPFMRHEKNTQWAMSNRWAV
jgi:hypothetical protein